MILPMFLILNNFKVDFASVALMSATRGGSCGGVNGKSSV